METSYSIVVIPSLMIADELQGVIKNVASKVRFPLQPYRTETSCNSLFPDHPDRTNDFETKEYAPVRYDTFEVENGLKKTRDLLLKVRYDSSGNFLNCT